MRAYDNRRPSGKPEVERPRNYGGTMWCGDEVEDDDDD